MELENQMGMTPSRGIVDARRHPRYKFETEIRVYPRNSVVVRGHSLDLSESGISAILREEIHVNEVVRLEFSVPDGDIEVHALVRQRNAFRYGFQFLESSTAHSLISRTCRELAIAQASSRNL